MFVYVYFHVYVHVSMVVFLSWCVSVFRHTRTSTFLLALLQHTLLSVVTIYIASTYGHQRCLLKVYKEGVVL